MSKTVSVFGGTGFIGSRYCSMYPDKLVKIPREGRVATSEEILYFISTIDNYNIHDNLHIDIDTNLTLLMEVLGATYNKTLHWEGEPPTFNFISSWFVYGQNHEIPFREDYSHCNPTGFYSITKRCAEQMLICFCQTFNINYRIFRLANVLGEGDKKISKKKNALQYLIREIVHDRDVNLYYGGEVLRDYIYVDDVCSALNLCIEKAPVNQIYNIGSGIPSRFLDIINMAISVARSESKIIHIEPTQFHNIVQVRHSYMDNTKIANLGFKQQYPIDVVVKKLVEHYKAEMWADNALPLVRKVFKEHVEK